MNTTLLSRDEEIFDDRLEHSAALLAGYVTDFQAESASIVARSLPQPPRTPPRRRWPVSLAALLVFLGGLFASGLCLYQAKSSWRPAVRQIQDYRVGQAVLADAERGDQDESLGDHVDPATWRHLVLRAFKKDGSSADVELLRRLSWLEERGAKVGGLIDIDVAHCGIEGEAQVLAIKPCPLIEPTPHGYRIVTGTFRHHGAEVIDLSVEGFANPIGTTANHPFWSEDRDEFVEAGDLEVGELLWSFDGQPNVVSQITPRGKATVYNLEVQFDHVFHVGTQGLLVHNVRECFEYERYVNKKYGGQAEVTQRRFFGNQGRARVADNVVRDAGKRVAIESKHTTNWERSLYNPASDAGRSRRGQAAQQRVEAQLQDYSENFDEVRVHVNSTEMRDHFQNEVNRLGLSNISVLFTP